MFLVVVVDRKGFSMRTREKEKGGEGKCEKVKVKNEKNYHLLRYFSLHQQEKRELGRVTHS